MVVEEGLGAVRRGRHRGFSRRESFGEGVCVEVATGVNVPIQLLGLITASSFWLGTWTVPSGSSTNTTIAEGRSCQLRERHNACRTGQGRCRFTGRLTAAGGRAIFETVQSLRSGFYVRYNKGGISVLKHSYSRHSMCASGHTYVRWMAASSLSVFLGSALLVGCTRRAAGPCWLRWSSAWR